MEETKVTVIDSICGSGKTSWAIQEMNNNMEQRYIYITPYLDEVKRVKANCSNRFFHEPNQKLGKGSKYNHFVELLEEGKNIVSTHTLFRNIDKQISELIQKYNYTLILDEVMNVIEKNVINSDDLKILKDMKIIEIKDNQVYWINDNYSGELSKYKNSCLNGDMFIIDNKVIMWTFPVSIFKSFKHIYIMTFLFEGQAQKYYYDMYNIDYEYKSVEFTGIQGFGTEKKRTYKLVDYKEADRTQLRELINIYEGKYNNIGRKISRENPLSMSWFDRQKENKTDQLDKLKSNIENYFKNSCKEELANGKKKAYKGKYNLWTIPKSIAMNEKGNMLFKVRNNTKNFLSWNTRATNEYRHKINVAYCINLYMNVIDYKFFYIRNIKINEDIWALGEMIQFIFRTQIRNNKPINIYIPSERMRNLLKDWLNS